MASEDWGMPKHPDADKLDVGTWDTSGHCICGESLPAQKNWDGQPHPWPSVTCKTCGRCYVDEDDFIAIYDEGCEEGTPLHFSPGLSLPHTWSRRDPWGGDVKPYYDEDGITIYHGDCFDILHDLSGVGAVITDPPYSSGGSFRGDRAQSTTTKYTSVEYRADFAGDTRDQRSFLAWSSLWLNAARNASVPGAVVASFIDWRQLPTLTDALQSGGWSWRGVAVWDKTLKARPAAGVFTAQSEFVVWGTSGPSIRRELGYQIPGVFSWPAPDNKDRAHIAEKPRDVMRWVLSIVPEGALILDPFMGSGSTLQAAKDLGFKAIGIDVDERYCEIAVQRLAQGVLAYG